MPGIDPKGTSVCRGRSFLSVKLFLTGPQIRKCVPKQIQPTKIQDLEASLFVEITNEILGTRETSLYVPDLVA
jgi:hypothetical protein